MADHWWLTATTPTGVHLYDLGPDTLTPADRTAIVAKVRTDLGFTGDPAMVPDPPWNLVFSPGTPAIEDDAVSVHDVTATRGLIGLPAQIAKGGA